MSIYNKVGEVKQLISKLKLFTKAKTHLLLKSIEQQTYDACAAGLRVGWDGTKKVVPWDEPSPPCPMGWDS
jgi:hypothetical protein